MRPRIVEFEFEFEFDSYSLASVDDTAPDALAEGAGASCRIRIRFLFTRLGRRHGPRRLGGMRRRVGHSGHKRHGNVTITSGRERGVSEKPVGRERETATAGHMRSGCGKKGRLVAQFVEQTRFPARVASHFSISRPVSLSPYISTLSPALRTFAMALRDVSRPAVTKLTFEGKMSTQRALCSRCHGAGLVEMEFQRVPCPNQANHDPSKACLRCLIAERGNFLAPFSKTVTCGSCKGTGFQP